MVRIDVGKVLVLILFLSCLSYDVYADSLDEDHAAWMSELSLLHSALKSYDGESVEAFVDKYSDLVVEYEYSEDVDALLIEIENKLKGYDDSVDDVIVDRRSRGMGLMTGMVVGDSGAAVVKTSSDIEGPGILADKELWGFYADALVVTGFVVLGVVFLLVLFFENKDSRVKKKLKQNEEKLMAVKHDYSKAYAVSHQRRLASIKNEVTADGGSSTAHVLNEIVFNEGPYNEGLVEYVFAQVNKGFKLEQISKALVDNGWKANVVEHNVGIVKGYMLKGYMRSNQIR